MHIEDIYKRHTSNHFVLIQNFATALDERILATSEDLLIVVCSLMVVDGKLASDPINCYIGTQENIEDNYCLYVHQPQLEDTERFNAILEDIAYKIQIQDELDEHKLDEMLGGMTEEVMAKLKEDLDRILENHKESNK